MKKYGRPFIPSFFAFALVACANGAPPRGFTGSAGATGGSAAGSSAAGSNGGGNAGTSAGVAGSSSSGIGGMGGGPGTGGAVNGTAGGGGGNGGVAGSTPDGGTGGVGTTSAPGLRQGPFKILVLSTTLEFRHDSIPNGLQMLTDLGMASAPERAPGKIPGLAADSTWTVDHIGDGATWNGVKEPDEFQSKVTADNLKNYELFYSDSPTGKVFTNQPNGTGPAKKQIFVDFWNAGGSWAGQHSATDFENSSAWTWFQDNINGGWFTTHDGDGTPGTINAQSQYANHPILKGIPNPWNVNDEWYVENRDIEAVPGYKVLAKVTVSNSMLTAGPRPAIWINENANMMGGRSFYTIRGHNQKVFAEPSFRQLMLQGILWAVHRLPGGN